MYCQKHCFLHLTTLFIRSLVFLALVLPKNLTILSYACCEVWFAVTVTYRPIRYRPLFEHRLNFEIEAHVYFYVSKCTTWGFIWKICFVTKLLINIRMFWQLKISFTRWNSLLWWAKPVTIIAGWQNCPLNFV